MYGHEPTWLRDDLGLMRVGWMLLFGLAAVGAAVAVLFVGVRQIDHHVSKNNCTSFARESGYEVQWLDVGYWDYDCYVVTPKGLVPRGDITYIKQDPA